MYEVDDGELLRPLAMFVGLSDFSAVFKRNYYKAVFLSMVFKDIINSNPKELKDIRLLDATSELFLMRSSISLLGGHCVETYFNGSHFIDKEEN